MRYDAKKELLTRASAVGITGAAAPRLVLMALADHARDDGVVILSNAEKFLAWCGISERSLRSAVRYLEKKKILLVKRRTGRNNEYRLLSAPVEKQTVSQEKPSKPEPPQKSKEVFVDAFAEIWQEYQSIVPDEWKKNVTSFQRAHVQQLWLGYGAETLRKAFSALGERGKWGMPVLREACSDIRREELKNEERTEAMRRLKSRRQHGSGDTPRSLSDILDANKIGN